MDKRERFEVIHELKKEFSVCRLVQLAKVSRAGYYKWTRSQEQQVTARAYVMELKGHILTIHHQHPYYGYKRMRTALRREGIMVNHKRVRRLMRELGIRSCIRKKRPFYGRKPSVVFPNILKQDFYASKPLKKLATDITYIRVNDEFVYLSVVIDLYNNEVMAWSMSKRNDLALVHMTLDQLTTIRGMEGAILHSDQGFQYTSKAYARRLNDCGVTGSHSRRGNCFDNACIESFFSHLKTEEIYRSKPNSFNDAQQCVNRYVKFYNNHRFQTKLGERSPVEYRETLAA